ncbi:MAG: type II secretion system F family protein [Desulfuromonadales bacterium]
MSIFLGLESVQELPSAVLKKRLRRMALHGESSGIPDDLKHEIIEGIPPFERLLARLPLVGNLVHTLESAGLKSSPALFSLYILLASVVGFCAGYAITKSFIHAGVAVMLIALVVVLLLRQLKKRREEKFTGQLPDVLSILSRSLRAGHSINSAIELVGIEVADPAGELFRIAFEQQKLGVRIIDALTSMTQRIECLDLRFFITAVSINSEVGGNLSEVLDNLAETIRGRLKIQRQVRVITAQGRLSGYVLGVLPIVVFLGMIVMMPGYEEQLFREKLGRSMLIGAVLLQVIGFLVIRRIVNIRI